MEPGMFARFTNSLKEQRHALLSWLSGATQEERALRLGPASTASLDEHLQVLDGAIAKAEARELGRCTVCNDFVEQHWLETDYTTCVCIDHLSGEQRSRLEAELELSQKVQRALLPQTAPQLDGWEIAAYSRPASLVGGDYFDFGRFGNGNQAIVIADVMGKGMPASMLMASLQASLRIIVPESDSPVRVLERVNEVFCHNINLTKFVSVVVAELDVATGVLRYANAGHNPPFILRHAAPQGDGGIEPLLPTGAAIGLLEQARFDIRSVELQPGDTLVLYTDGVIDAGIPGGEMFGEVRLRDTLSAHRGLSAHELVGRLLQEIRTFAGSGPPSDDTTVVMCRRSLNTH